MNKLFAHIRRTYNNESGQKASGIQADSNELLMNIFGDQLELCLIDLNQQNMPQSEDKFRLVPVEGRAETLFNNNDSKISAVIIRISHGVFGGHYFVATFNSSTNEWFKCSDGELLSIPDINKFIHNYAKQINGFLVKPSNS